MGFSYGKDASRSTFSKACMVSTVGAPDLVFASSESVLGKIDHADHRGLRCWTETAQRCGTKMRLEPDRRIADFRGTTSHHRLFHPNVAQCKTHQIQKAPVTGQRSGSCSSMHATSSTASPVDTDDDSSRRGSQSARQAKIGNPWGETHVDECHKVEDTNTRLGKEGRTTQSKAGHRQNNATTPILCFKLWRD